MFVRRHGNVPADDVANRKENAQQCDDDGEYAQKLPVSEHQFKFALFVGWHQLGPLPQHLA
jgi:hypothetical protein